MTTEPLKPCPFCGGKNVEHNEPPSTRIRNYHVVGCEDCCADAPFTEWNERAVDIAAILAVADEIELCSVDRPPGSGRYGRELIAQWIATIRKACGKDEP